ncbi:MAG TPA: beta-N-acetylhexosaminidase [Hyphomicrobiaceae bacterium]|nr:beta-N-acetylhexosaminidase [Hyphomicrobiaceae bacterium]
MLSAFITGLAGPDLTLEEAALLRRARPCGIILFARNALDPAQLSRLTNAARDEVGEDILVLIDQEGGRVQRLKPPHWRALPAAAAYGRSYAADPAWALQAARAAARLTAFDLRKVGINANCAPLLDVPIPGSHGVIGDRAYAESPQTVAALGAAVAEGLAAGGVLPIMKHIPGHGRATADSHFELPVVTATLAELDASDLVPFRRLAALPAAMTAHVVFAALDADAPASISRRVTDAVIRGSIGFDGLLMSDDLAMKALTGSVAERAAAVLAAGSDVVLTCSGDLAESAAVAQVAPPLEGRARERFERARAVIGQQQPFQVAEAEAYLAEMLHHAA